LILILRVFWGVAKGKGGGKEHFEGLPSQRDHSLWLPGSEGGSLERKSLKGNVTPIETRKHEQNGERHLKGASTGSGELEGRFLKGFFGQEKKRKELLCLPTGVRRV